MFLSKEELNIYEVKSQADKAAKISSFILSESDTFRKLLVPELVRNSTIDEPKIKIAIVTERKNKKGLWEPIERISASTLKAKESQAIHLDSETTEKLLAKLLQLKEIASQGFSYTPKKYAVIPIEEPFQISHIQNLLKYPEEILNQLASITPPELVRNFAAGKIQEERQQAIREFETALPDVSKDEKFWQNFFSKHTWIFGYGLNYVFLHFLRVQPNLKGADLDGKGSQRGDYLMHTLGSKFTVIVEIKTPATDLLQTYRNKEEHAISQELAGGVSQVQSYCRNWEKEAQDATKNRKLIIDEIETIEPKGILIIGDTAELDTLKKKERFQLFRRNLKDPEIITFNELLARAKYLANSPV